MPLSKNEEALLGPLVDEEIEYDHQRVDRAPLQDDKIGRITVVLLILNRTIGSGIFLTPHRVLAGAGCVGGALLLWVLGAFISLCGLYVWLECGLSMPQRTIRGEANPRGVPRECSVHQSACGSIDTNMQAQAEKKTSSNSCFPAALTPIASICARHALSP